MPDTSKLEKATTGSWRKAKRNCGKAINDEKAIAAPVKAAYPKGTDAPALYPWRYAGSFLQEPERLTDDDVMLLLKLIFHRQDTQELLKKLLEREMPEPP